MNASYQVDDEDLIEVVRGRPQLWKLSEKGYRNSQLTAKNWEEVAVLLSTDVEYVKRRWRSIRDRFVKDVRADVKTTGQAAKRSMPWHLREQLSFLRDSMSSRPLASRLALCCSYVHRTVSNFCLVTGIDDQEVSSEMILEGDMTENFSPFSLCNESTTFNDQPMPSTSKAPKPLPTSSDQPMPSTSKAPKPLPTSSDQPMPSTSKAPKPLPTSSDQPMPSTSKAPKPQPPSVQAETDKRSTPVCKAKTRPVEIDPFEEAVLSKVASQREYTQTELFYLSVARCVDAADLSLNTRIALQMKTMAMVQEAILKEGSIKTLNENPEGLLTVCMNHFTTAILARKLHITPLAMSKKSKKAPIVPQEQKPSDGPVELDKSGSIRLRICAKPGAKTNAITGIEEEGVGVQINAPPMDGEANAELVKFISKVFDVKKSCVSLDKGSRSRQKVILLSDTKLTVEQVLEILKRNAE